LFVPAGTPTAFTGDGEPHVRPRLMFAYNRRDLAAPAMVGGHIRGRDQPPADGRLGAPTFAAAPPRAPPPRRLLLLAPEFQLSTVVSADSSFGKYTTAAEALVGGRIEFFPRVRLGAAAGTGLTDGFGAPSVRGALSLEWVPDIPPPPKPEPSELPPDRDGD